MDSSIQSIGAPLRQNSASPKGPGGPPSHESIISQFGKSLTEEQRTLILKTIGELQESRASFEGIKGVVDSFLEENGTSPLRAKEALLVDRSTIKVSFLN